MRRGTLSALYNSSRVAWLLLLLACAGGTCWYAARRQEPRLPFTGVAAGHGLRGWQSLGGAWTVQGGTVTNDSYERGAKLLGGAADWKDYGVSAEVRMDGAGGDAGLILRSGNEQEGPNAYSGYYAGVRSLDGRLVLGRAQYGWLESRTAVFPGGVSPHRWYRLQVAAVGCDVLAVARDPATGARGSVELKGGVCLTRGRIGLRSYGTAAQWRQIRAQSMDVSQLAAMRLHATAKQGTQSPAVRPALQSAQAPPVASIDSLRYGPLMLTAPVRIRGTVVLRRPMLFVEDATGAIGIPGQDPSGFAIGDEVEATGMPLVAPFQLLLQDASVQVIEPGRPLPPTSVTGTEEATGAYTGQYVELIGRVVRWHAGARRSSLEIAADGQTFRVIQPPPSFGEPVLQLSRNSLVRVRGVGVVATALAAGSTPFLLYLPDARSIELLARPPWYSLQNAVWLVPMAAVVLLAWLLLRTRERHMRLHAVMEERQRLGRELHDTLAQSFAGIGYQLQAVRAGLRSPNASVHAHVDLALSMVRESHQEARRSIASMQPDLADGRALAALLAERACHMAHGTPLRIDAEMKGEARPLSPRAADALFRTGLEAIANALRHADPQTLRIVLQFSRAEITLRIADDGCGFDESQQEGGLGLRGMRARAEAAGARIVVRSSPGAGTEVLVRVPARGAHGMAQRLWRRKEARQG